MKILHILILAAFMLSLFSTPAQAQDIQGGVIGYVVLVDGSNPNIPLYTQSRQAFDRLVPELLDAQKDGSILSFDPEFQFGILRIEFNPGMQVSALQSGLTVYGDAREAIAQARALSPVQANNEIEASAAAPSFYTYLYGGCFSAKGLPAYAHVFGSFTNAAGIKVAAYEGDAYSNGELRDCFSGRAYYYLIPGYKVTFVVFSSSGELLNTYTSIAPKLNFTTINKANSILGGTGSANLPYTVSWYHQNLNANNTWRYQYLTGTITSTGSWGMDFGDIPIRGGDDFYLDVTKGSITFERSFTAPYSFCELGDNYCAVHGFPTEDTFLSFTHAGIRHPFTGKTDRDGFFAAELNDTSGNPINLVAGDTIAGKNIPGWKLVPMTAAINYNSDVISGKAPANKFISVKVFPLYDYTGSSKWIKSGTLGNYAANFSTLIDLKSTAAYRVEINYINPITGNNQTFNPSFGW